MNHQSVLSVSGLNKEAQIAGRAGIMAIAAGGSRAELEKRLASIDPGQVSAVVSFGIAGALDPSLQVGDLILADLILDGPTRHSCSTGLRGAWARHLQAEGTIYREMSIAGSDAHLLEPGDKAALRARSGGAAVDMESHVAAAYAARYRLPFGAIRVISDTAYHVLPQAAGSAMRPDGSVDVLGVLKSLARDPAQIPGLIVTARDAAVAFRALRRVRGLLDLSGSLLGLDL